MSEKNVLVVPMQIQLHLSDDASGHHIDGAPPWVDPEKLLQWGKHVEAVLRKHAVAHGIHLAIMPGGAIVAHYCKGAGVTKEIDAEVGAGIDTLIEALLTDPDTVDQYEPDGIGVIVLVG